MENRIKLGYEIVTGRQVDVRPSHLIVTGITQLSGKTTTLEALIKRSGLKAIVFKTKIGEKSFTEGTEIPPFFRDRSDYEFVKSLIEAYTKEKLFLEKGTLMRLCKGAGSLLEIKKRVDETLAEGKLRGLKEEIHTRLQHYLENLIPQIQYAKLSKVLSVYDGINVMNLERFSEEAQSLLIQSTAAEVLNTMNGIIIVIPEAWKFIPQKYNNPCKRVVESFIRQGATNNNFVWVDSQDMAGVDKIPLKQISTWILGYQSERNEVKHTLDQISLPKKSKPTEDEIMNLKKGHFYLSSYDGVVSVYVQPSWLSDEDAIKVAMGAKNVEEIETPNNLTPHSIAPAPREKEGVGIGFDDSKIRKQMVELRQDFFNKIEEMQTAIQKAFSEICGLKTQQQHVDTDEIVSLVLQKMPSSSGNGVNKEEIVSEVLARVPKSAGAVTYEVAPQEALTKGFLEKEKQLILDDVSKATPKAKETLKFIESVGKGMEMKDVCMRLAKTTTGGASQVIRNTLNELARLRLIRKDTHARVFPYLKDRISDELGFHNATEQQIVQVYNHILNEMV